MMAVLLQVLDTTIANVALPHMQASLSATQESINWVLTSYIVASAIALPISGWLADRVGRKRLLLVSVVGFTIASVLCASAVSLTEMVLFRALQGFPEGTPDAIQGQLADLLPSAPDVGHDTKPIQFFDAAQGGHQGGDALAAQGRARRGEVHQVGAVRHQGGHAEHRHTRAKRRALH